MPQEKKRNYGRLIKKYGGKMTESIYPYKTGFPEAEQMEKR